MCVAPGTLHLPSCAHCIQSACVCELGCVWQLRVSKLVLDMRNYNSMVLIPDGDSDVDDDGMGDEIMRRMANVEVGLGFRVIDFQFGRLKLS